MLARMVVKSLIRSGGSSLWTLGALASCSALISLFATVALDVRNQMRHQLRRLGPNAVVFARTNWSADLRWEQEASVDWSRFRQIAGRFGATYAVESFFVGALRGEPVGVVTVDPDRMQDISPYWAVTGHWMGSGEDECMVGRQVADRFGLRPGSRLTLQVSSGSGPQTRQLRVVGVFETGDEDEKRVFLPQRARGEGGLPHPAPSARAGLEVERSLPDGHPKTRGLEPGTRVDCLSCHAHTPPPPATGKLDQDFGGTHPSSRVTTGYALASMPGGEEGVRRFARALREAKLGLTVEPLRQVLHGQEHVLGKVGILVGAALACTVMLTLVSVSAAMLARVVERRQELALLASLGATRKSLAKFILAESTALAVLAGLTGFAGGTLLAEYVAQKVFHVWVMPQWLALTGSLLLAGGMAIGSSTIAALRALRLVPAAVLRGE